MRPAKTNNIKSGSCMKISRRTVLAASASVPFLSPGQASAASATIQIHSGRHRGEIDRKLFGNFIEHLGRCITGGIFDEGSPLSDSQGYPQGRADGGEGDGRSVPALAGRQLRLQLQLDGWYRPARQATGPAGNGLGHGRGQPLRYPRIHGLYREGRRRALYLPQSRHRHLGRGAAVDRICQRHPEHRGGADAQEERPRQALES